MFYLVEFFQTFGRIFLFAYAFYDFPLCSITVFMQLIMKIYFKCSCTKSIMQNKN